LRERHLRLPGGQLQRPHERHFDDRVGQLFNLRERHLLLLPNLHVTRPRYVMHLKMNRSQRIAVKIDNELKGIEKLITRHTLNKTYMEIIDSFKDFLPLVKKFVRAAHPVAEHIRSFHYFNSNLLSIEVTNEKHLIEKVYFRTPRICDEKKETDMVEFRRTLKLESHGSDTVNFKAFIEDAEALYYQLKHRAKLSNKMRTLSKYDKKYKDIQL
jgi:hypothetical protein